MSIGENIKKLRKEKGLTQKQLGILCQPPIDEANIRKYENDKQNPKIETLEKIANALDCKVSDIREFDGSIRVKITPESIEFDRLIRKHKANENLTEEERQWLINYLETNNFKDTFERLKEVGQNILESLNYCRLQNAYETLNKDGQEKVIEHAELIAKIPEYQKKPPEPPQE